MSPHMPFPFTDFALHDFCWVLWVFLVNHQTWGNWGCSTLMYKIPSAEFQVFQKTIIYSLATCKLITLRWLKLKVSSIVLTKLFTFELLVKHSKHNLTFIFSKFKVAISTANIIWDSITWLLHIISTYVIILTPSKLETHPYHPHTKKKDQKNKPICNTKQFTVYHNLGSDTFLPCGVIVCTGLAGDLTFHIVKVPSEWLQINCFPSWCQATEWIAYKKGVMKSIIKTKAYLNMKLFITDSIINFHITFYLPNRKQYGNLTFP